MCHLPVVRGGEFAFISYVVEGYGLRVHDISHKWQDGGR